MFQFFILNLYLLVTFKIKISIYRKPATFEQCKLYIYCFFLKLFAIILTTAANQQILIRDNLNSIDEIYTKTNLPGASQFQHKMI